MYTVLNITDGFNNYSITQILMSVNSTYMTAIIMQRVSMKSATSIVHAILVLMGVEEFAVSLALISESTCTCTLFFLQTVVMVTCC